jgi:thiamine biosynthesis lipoprotein
MAHGRVPEIVGLGADSFGVRFDAMACPCEVLFDHCDRDLATRLGTLAAEEAWRIESKFSRYRSDSVTARINSSAGLPVTVDAETAALLDFAAQCHRLSGGAFDITSGILRRLWRFEPGATLPKQAELAAVRALIGFDKLAWVTPVLTVPAGMEIDLGGLGKEYAVDRALALVRERAPGAVLVNFGGDLAVSGPTIVGPWRVGVERPDTDRDARLLLELSLGGLATSGDTHRFLVVDGVRYGHIMDVRTGWPVRDAPRSVTVAAGTCVEAGMLATLAMLKGADAESFLATEGVAYWCLR